MLEITITDGAGAELTAVSVADSRPFSIHTKLVGWAGDGPSVRAAKPLRVKNGAVPEKVRRGGRQLTVAGIAGLETRAETWALERLLAGMFADGEPGTMEVRQDGAPLSTMVQLDGPPKIDANTDNCSIEWELALFAPSSYLHGPERQATMTPAGTGAGLMYPLAYPLSYGNDLGSPNAALSNSGNADAWPTFTVTGDFPSGFRISMSGRVIEYPYATFWTTPVVVDMAGHVMVGGVDQQAALTRREWASIPAEGVAVATFEPIQSGGTGACVATVRDTFI